MPRKLRIEWAGSCYHVINRGNYRRDLFTPKGRGGVVPSLLARGGLAVRVAPACVRDHAESLSSRDRDAGAELERRHEMAAGNMGRAV